MFLKALYKQAKKTQRQLNMKSTTQWEKENIANKKIKPSGDLDKDIAHLRELTGNCCDIVVTTFYFGENASIKGAIVYIDGLADQKYITSSILEPLKLYRGNDITEPETPCDIIQVIQDSVLCAAENLVTDEFNALVQMVYTGDTILLVNGSCKGLAIATKGWQSRSIAEPQTEAVVRGPRECFTENLRTNTALLRRRIKTPDFKIDHTIVGKRSQTTVCIAYLDGVCDEKIVEEVKTRINNINVDAIIDSSFIEEYIDDHPFSIFSTINYTEKPDVAVARILEGRVAIISDGSPFVLTAPMLFIESFQSAEDYYARPFYASIVRLLRFVAFLIAILVPAAYIALTAFHQELIPTTLLFTIAEAREGTPFGAFIETFVMVMTFEILREAGLRLPRPVGQAISIVGALVMGESAVSAGIVGAPVVIAVAISAVSGFVVPNQNDVASILRIVAMLFAAVLGGYGIALVFLGIMLHLASIKSFGVDYFEGFLPIRNMQDSFIRLPLWTMVNRPKSIVKGDVKRKNFFVPPNNEKKDDNS